MQPSLKLYGIAAATCLVAPLGAHEVDTHAVMTKRAAERSLNFQSFLHDNTSFSQTGELEVFPQGYPTDEVNAFIAANRGTRYNSRGKHDVYDCMMAGSVLEDASPRWLKHFYDPYTQQGAWFQEEAHTAATVASVLCSFTPWSGDCATAAPLFLGPQTPSPDWATTDAANAWRWQAALDYYEQAFTLQDASARAEARAHLYRSLGHVLHLLQDLSQPSHVRNDAHAGHYLWQHWVPGDITGHSALEVWEAGHLRSEAGWDPTVEALGNLYGPEYLRPDGLPKTTRDYFTDLATWTASHYFSDDTVFGAKWNSALHTSPTPFDVLAPTSTQQRYVESAGAPSLFPGSAGTRLAEAQNVLGIGYPIAPGPAWEATPEAFDLDDDTVVADTAAHVVNKGIAQSEALLDHFFRGRIHVSYVPISGYLRIVNEASEGGAALALGPGTWNAYYTSVNGNLVSFENIPGFTNGDFGPVLGGMTPGQSFDIDGRSFDLGLRSNLWVPESTRVDKHSRVIVVYHGVIGSEVGFAVGVAAPRRAYTFEAVEPPPSEPYAGHDYQVTWSQVLTFSAPWSPTSDSAVWRFGNLPVGDDVITYAHLNYSDATWSPVALESSATCIDCIDPDVFDDVSPSFASGWFQFAETLIQVTASPPIVGCSCSDDCPMPCSWGAADITSNLAGRDIAESFVVGAGVDDVVEYWPANHGPVCQTCALTRLAHVQIDCWVLGNANEE